MYHIFFIHSSVDGYLGCFHVLAIVSSATMNIGVHVSFRNMVFSRYMPRSGTAVSYSSSIFIYLFLIMNLFGNFIILYWHILFLKINLFIYFIYFWLCWVFVAAQSFSSCGEQRLLSVAVCGLLIAVASLVVKRRL